MSICPYWYHSCIFSFFTRGRKLVSKTGNKPKLWHKQRVFIGPPLNSSSLFLQPSCTNSLFPQEQILDHAAWKEKVVHLYYSAECDHVWPVKRVHPYKIKQSVNPLTDYCLLMANLLTDESSSEIVFVPFRDWKSNFFVPGSVTCWCGLKWRRK